MRWCAGLVVLLLAAGAAADPLDPFIGSWRAHETAVRIGTLPEAARDLLLEIRRDRDGVEVVWRALGGDTESATFRPTERPGVLAPPPESPGLIGRFFSTDRGNPLRGQRLVWLRVEDGVLVLYGMVVDGEGDPTLDRRALRPDGEGLALDVQRRGGAGEVLRLDARLERSGR